MHFNLSDEQKLIRNAVDKFIRNDYSFDARKKVLALENGFSPEHWRQFADMGWLGIPFSEDQGGLGGGIVDIVQVMEAFGSGMVLEPYLTAVVLAGGLIARGGSAAQQEVLLPGLIGGEKLLAVAYTERESRFNPADVQTRAEKSGDGYVISGEKAVVLGRPRPMCSSSRRVPAAIASTRGDLPVPGRCQGAGCRDQGLPHHGRWLRRQRHSEPG